MFTDTLTHIQTCKLCINDDTVADSLVNYWDEKNEFRATTIRQNLGAYVAAIHYIYS